MKAEGAKQEGAGTRTDTDPHGHGAGAGRAARPHLRYGTAAPGVTGSPGHGVSSLLVVPLELTQGLLERPSIRRMGKRGVVGADVVDKARDKARDKD